MEGVTTPQYDGVDTRVSAVWNAQQAGTDAGFTALSQSDALHAGLTGSKLNTRQYVIVIGCLRYRVESRSVSSDRCRYPVLARMNGLDKHKS